jgi:DNA-directed RNA polymerase subunit beta'
MDGNKHEFLITKDKQVLVHDAQVVNKGEMIVDGPADPQDILRLLGIEALARYIVDDVWEAEERQALLQQEKANMAAELQAMEDQQNAAAPVEQHGDGE